MNWKEQPWYKEKACRAQFNAHGFPCLAFRHPQAGQWVGYIAVGEGHPVFGEDMLSEKLSINIHGGVTFSNLATPPYHTFRPENPAEKVWLIGFDCGHCFDVTPCVEVALFAVRHKMPGSNKQMWADQTWKDLPFVKTHCISGAEQLAEMGPSGLPPVQDILWEATDAEMERQVNIWMSSDTRK